MANAIDAIDSGPEMPHPHTVHVLNNEDVALGGRRRWCWTFFKQTT